MAYLIKSIIEGFWSLESFKVGVNFMVKVKITRDCFIKGKSYRAGDIAEVIEKDAHYLMAIEKGMAYDGKPEPKMVKKGRR
jgi:hypothetical protein